VAIATSFHVLARDTSSTPRQAGTIAFPPSPRRRKSRPIQNESGFTSLSIEDASQKAC
jgi:hypothetical protein